MSQQEPSNLDWKIEEKCAALRLFGMDMAILFARKAKGTISHDQFLYENDELGRSLAEWYDNMDPDLRDPNYAVLDLEPPEELDPDDIVDPYVPGLIFNGPLWTMNLAIIDWYMVVVMHQFQTAATLQMMPSPDILTKATQMCQLIEAVEYYPDRVNGALIAIQASLGAVGLVLPRDKKHSMWCRKKLAMIENQG
jgi:hypothetical protein